MMKIRGNTQIMAETLYDAQISPTAAIALSKLAEGAEIFKRNGSVALTGALNAGGNKLTNVGLATADSDVATWGQVQAVAQSLQLKDAVRVASVAAGNVDIAVGGLLVIDDVQLVAGDRVLLKNQTNAAENGIYVAAAGAWARSSDADGQPDPNNEVKPGMFCFVSEGTVNADTGWVLATNGVITVGTTELSFVQFSAAGVLTVGSGLQKVGNQVSIAEGGVTNAMLAGSIETAKLAEGAELVKRDGTVAFTGDIDAGTHKVVNVVTGVADTDAVNVKQLSDAIAAVDVTSQIQPIKDEVDAIELGAGLAADGTYAADATTNYLQAATSLANADKLLDAQVKLNADAIAALEQSTGEGSGAIQTELDATQVGAGLGADGAYAADATTNYLQAATSLTDADKKLDAQVKVNADAIAAAVQVSTNLQAEVDAVEAAAGLNADGTFAAFTGTNYLDAATSLKNADVLLDTQVKALADGKVDKTAISVDGTFATVDDVTVPSTKAVKDYLSGQVADNAVGFVDAEVPTGAIDGVNVNFTLAGVAAPAESVHVFVNGLRTATASVTVGATSTTFVLTTAPQAGDVITADYRI